MGGRIYLLQDDGELVDMAEEPYDSEDRLQALLADYPSLLAGEQMDSATPRRWLLISREAGVPSHDGGGAQWSLDHLFLDQDAIPTLVEVKRSSDTRIRREVVGQLLDYAANGVVYWPVERIRAMFDATCQAGEVDAEQVLADFLDGDTDPERFWQDVKTNLQAGRVRLVFVADEIPNELRRVVEFLNAQMDPAEVLAVEIKQYVGSQMATLVPRVVGQTAEAQARKGGVRATKEWNEASFLGVLKDKHGDAATSTAKRIHDWAIEHQLRIWWGSGAQDGSLFPVCDFNGESHSLFAIWTYGRVQAQFGQLQKNPPFADEENRLEMLRCLNAIPGVDLPEDSLNRSPAFPISLLEDEESLKVFLDTFSWAINLIKTS